MKLVSVNRNVHNRAIISARVLTEEQKAAYYNPKMMGHLDPHVESRNDWKTFEAAKAVAAHLPGYIATDAGPHVSPRYDIVQLPKVGDEVSYSFNGDTYPCGKVTAISKSLKVVSTDSGKKFYRVRETGTWRNAGTWSLVGGHHYEQNPSF